MSAGRSAEGAVATRIGAPAASHRDPTTHLLRLFLTVADELHFGRAAARLYITQSALSRQVRTLEQHLGVALFERDSRTVSLTPAGRDLLPRCRAAVEAMAQVRHAAASHRRRVGGQLVLGAIGAEASMPYAHAVLTELRGRHPDITVTVRSLGFAAQFRSVICGEVDAAFLWPPLPTGLQGLALSTERRVVCLSADDPLARSSRRSPLRLARLARHPVADVPAGVPRVWWDGWAVNPRPDGTGVRPGPVVDDIEAMLHTVARGQAIAFVPAAFRRLYPRPGVSYADVSDLPPVTAVLAWSPARRDLPVVAGLRQVAHDVVHAHAPASTGGPGRAR
ncbi:LysR family transcriptional regulator [Streptomyces sp. SID5643]|uniref:LysR family transcriptional regulator n=1 Tax=Streptomyces sp. SID5643 TaxID=2690307 RepID=UPI00137083E7|nr:LysR family transcriptional regulator [Streptomyces sp. SID5643]MZF87871.1 LysR family transcriptional regulator [Streptomyces sp. SID5643]